MTYLLVAFVVSLGAAGQENVSLFTVDVGYASIHDSYLTPITYGGTDLALGYEVTRSTRFAPDKWLWQLGVAADYNYVENDARNNNLHKLMGDIMQRMRDHERVQVFLTQRVLTVLFSMLTFVVFGIVLLKYNWLVFLVFLLGSVLYGGWVVLFLGKRKK